MRLGRRVIGICLLMAGVAGLTACQDGDAAPASAAPSASVPASASASATTAPPSPTPASVRTPPGWPAGLPVPTASLTDAAALKAYVDSLTPEQRTLFGAAVRQGMSASDRQQLADLGERLKQLPQGALEQCTALVPVGATAAAVGLGASDDSAAQVAARRRFAASLDQLRADTHPSARVERDLRLMADALRRHASSGRALTASAGYTESLDDIARFVDETCATH